MQKFYFPMPRCVSGALLSCGDDDHIGSVVMINYHLGIISPETPFIFGQTIDADYIMYYSFIC